jgi:hypothetical protein
MCNTLIIAAYKRWMDQALPTTLFDPFFQSTVPATNNRIECSRNGLQKLTKSRYSRPGNWKLRLTMNLKHHIMWKIYRPQNLNCNLQIKRWRKMSKPQTKLLLSLSPTTLLHILSSKFLSRAEKMP